MKLAHWAALILLILSFTCCMWIGASVAAQLLLPNAMPPGTGMTPDQVVIGAIICMIAPVTMAAASGLTWFFGIRQQKSPSGDQPGHAPAQQPQSKSTVEASAQQAATSGLDQYLEQLSALLLTGDSALPGSVRPQIKALTRQALTTLDSTGRQRVIFCLQSLRLALGDESLDLYGLDLAGVDLRFASLRGVNLAGANLRGARLTGADLQGAELSDCDLSEVDLRLACLNHACMERARLKHARLQRASLRAARLQHAQLDQASLWQADLSEAIVNRAQLATAASIEGAILPAEQV